MTHFALVQHWFVDFFTKNSNKRRPIPTSIPIFQLWTLKKLYLIRQNIQFFYSLSLTTR